MSEQKTIHHKGVIQEIRGGTAKVLISSQSACASCHAKGACSAADREEKIIDVKLPGKEVEVGEHVDVLITSRAGLKAVAFGYVYPFLILMVLLVVLTAAGVGELQAGLLALLSLVPYYVMIFLARNRLGTIFSFTLQKQNLTL